MLAIYLSLARGGGHTLGIPLAEASSASISIPWAPCGAHWPHRTLSLRSEHMGPFWSFWHKATSCKDPKGLFNLPPPSPCNSYLGTHMKFPLITQSCQWGDGAGVVQVNPLLYPSSRGKKQAWLESRDAECQTSGTTESWGSEWKIFWNTPDKHHPFPLLGCQRSQFSEDITDKRVW